MNPRKDRARLHSCSRSRAGNSWKVRDLRRRRPASCKVKSQKRVSPGNCQTLRVKRSRFKPRNRSNHTNPSGLRMTKCCQIALVKNQRAKLRKSRTREDRVLSSPSPKTRTGSQSPPSEEKIPSLSPGRTVLSKAQETAWSNPRRTRREDCKTQRHPARKKGESILKVKGSTMKCLRTSPLQDQSSWPGSRSWSLKATLKGTSSCRQKQGTSN